MNSFEDDLRQALRRKEPPGGFAERVVARAASRSGFWHRLRRGLELPLLRWSVAVAVVLAVVGGIEFHRQRQERIHGEQAKQQVMLALQITARELYVAQRKIQDLNTAR
jgi:hypothetical protein